MRTLLALDPGGTTGWSWWNYSETEPLTLVDCGQVVGGLEGFLKWWPDAAHADEVVSETFRLDGRTVKPDVTPLKIEGALSVLRPDWVGQANGMKIHAPDAFLKKHGLWLRGQQHARDSIRHAVAYVKLRRHLPSIEKFWPKRGDG